MNEWMNGKWTWKRTECIYTLLCVKYVTTESLLYSTRGKERDPYVKQITRPSSMHQSGYSKPVHWDNQRDGMGKVGGGVQDGDTCTPVADSCQSVSSAAQSCPTLCEPVDCSMPCQCMAKTTTIL